MISMSQYAAMWSMEGYSTIGHSKRWVQLFICYVLTHFHLMNTMTELKYWTTAAAFYSSLMRRKRCIENNSPPRLEIDFKEELKRNERIQSSID